MVPFSFQARPGQRKSQTKAGQKAFRRPRLRPAAELGCCGLPGHAPRAQISMPAARAGDEGAKVKQASRARCRWNSFSDRSGTGRRVAKGAGPGFKIPIPSPKALTTFLRSPCCQPTVRRSWFIAHGQCQEALQTAPACSSISCDYLERPVVLRSRLGLRVFFCAAMARSAPKPAPKSIPEEAQTDPRRTTGNLKRMQVRAASTEQHTAQRFTSRRRRSASAHVSGAAQRHAPQKRHAAGRRTC